MTVNRKESMRLRESTVPVIQVLDGLLEGGHLQGLSQVSAAELVTLADGLLEQTISLAAVRDTLLLASIGRNSRGSYRVKVIVEELADSGRLRQLAHRAAGGSSRTGANGAASEG